MKRYLTILLSVFTLAAMAQDNVLFEKDNFPNDKEGFKEAKFYLKEADKIFEEGNKSQFNLCIPNYEKAYAFNPDNAELNYKLGVCYLYSATKAKSLAYFEKSYSLDPNYDSYNIKYLLGRGYHLNSQWDEAIEAYDSQLIVLKSNEATEEEFRVIRKYLEEAKYGKEISAVEVRVWVDNLGPNINSAAPEYAPLISTDESLIIITARREDSTDGLIDDMDNLPYEDLYYSKNVGGEWTPLTNLGKTVNTGGHDASSGLSSDGKTLFVFRGTLKGGGDVYVSNNSPEGFTKPKALGKNINSAEHESAVSLTYDGQKLYFVSEREGGYGGKDIYVSQWDAAKEQWGEAKNLGPVVNSEYDEDGVFIHPDGVTIYFSSEGHNTMGGNDIFYSEMTNGQWGKPINIGVPINTPDDDVFFVVAADGRTAYYSSIRKDGYGEKDIYRITFLGPEKPPVLNVEDQLLVESEEKNVEVPLQPQVKVRTSKMILLKGVVIDEETNAPISAAIDLTDNETSEVLATFATDAISGSYLVSLPAGHNYGLNVNADGYLFNSMHFDIPDTAAFKEVYKVIKLKKIKIGKTIVLRNIFFDYNKYTLREESYPELERLQVLMVENPTIKVEISGHTDDVGGDEYNRELSENRAKAVVDYLVSNGIAQDRLIYAGYGESQPIASNEKPEGRQENRRTEFKIIE
jgi:outer membrane protein OmpA-like peptidoglycan-associated protein/tetratricopeptide (TPR) repeat protein